MGINEDCKEAKIEVGKEKPKACHPSVITTPHVKHCGERETKGNWERNWKNKISS